MDIDGCVASLWGMIRLLIGFVASVALMLSSFGAEVPDPAVEQQLRDVEQAWIKAENNHDAAALRPILDERFISTFDADEPLDKEGFIKYVTKGAPNPSLSQTLSNLTIRVAGDTAIVVGTDTVTRTREGKVLTNVLRYTVTYIRRDGRWRALAEHLVSVPPPK